MQYSRSAIERGGVGGESRSSIASGERAEAGIFFFVEREILNLVAFALLSLCSGLQTLSSNGFKRFLS